MAIDESEVIIFVVDAKCGITGDDHDVAALLRRSQKQVVLAVNKVDNFSRSHQILAEFFELGLGEPIPVSAANGLNIGDLLDSVVAHLPAFPEHDEDDSISIAIIGRPNVGKSSLFNRLAGQERSVVSDIPGTTRDAIDTRVVHAGMAYSFIDTAGLRKKSRVGSGIEYYSMLRSIRAVERCDIALIVLDGQDGLTEQDKRIAGIAHEAGKAAILLVNKWDIVEKDSDTMVKYRKELQQGLQFMTYANIEFVSALTGARCARLFPLILATMEEYKRRIGTGLLNDLLNDAVLANPPAAKGRKVKIYYMTQAAIKPPRFVLFVNAPELLHFSWLRYLENRLRAAFGFAGTPIHFIIRKRGK